MFSPGLPPDRKSNSTVGVSAQGGTPSDLPAGVASFTAEVETDGAVLDATTPTALQTAKVTTVPRASLHGVAAVYCLANADMVSDTI